MLTEPVGN